MLTVNPFLRILTKKPSQVINSSSTYWVKTDVGNFATDSFFVAFYR